MEDYGEYDDALQEVVRLAGRCLTLLEREHPGTPAEQRAALSMERRRQERLEQGQMERFRSGGTAPLEYLMRAFSLTPFERRCVYLSLAAELDSTLESRFAELQHDRCRLPSLDLCLRTYTVDPGERFDLLGQWQAREDTLRFFFRTGYRGGEQQSGLSPGLKLERRIPGFLLDCTSREPDLEGMAEIYWPGGEELPPMVLREELVSRMTEYTGGLPGGSHVLFYLKGAQGSGRRTLARHFCMQEGRPLVFADLNPLFQSGMSWEEILTRLLREAILWDAALAVTGFELLALPESERKRGTETRTDQAYYIRTLMERAARGIRRLFLLSPEPWHPETPCTPWQRIELELDVPDAAGRLALWKHYLGDNAPEDAAGLEPLAVKFALQPGQIADAAAEAVRLACWERMEKPDAPLLHRACRNQLSHNLGKKAVRVNAAYTWEDLILPPEQKRQLQNACNQVEQRRKVYDQWGFGKKVAYGRGVSMLFSGPPGTGKTMAAQVIANRLDLELYKVDLSGVISKYVGETEQQLGSVFEEVKRSQSILFFDEADALFGKRSETKDSHDRYANIETSYLLQKMEEYDGIVILASNFSQNFDEAFKRRLKFIIDFTLPDRERREQIWRSVLPPELPLAEELDFDFLARSFELSGSSIKNIAVSAAFLAAGEGRPMGMVHLLLAARAEQNKTGKNLGREEFGEYFHLVQGYLRDRTEQE